MGLQIYSFFPYYDRQTHKMFHFKALFLAMALLKQDSLCPFGLTKTFRFMARFLAMA